MLFKEKLKSNSKIFLDGGNGSEIAKLGGEMSPAFSALASIISPEIVIKVHEKFIDAGCCLLYTSPSPRDLDLSRMPSSA